MSEEKIAAQEANKLIKQSIGIIIKNSKNILKDRLSRDISGELKARIKNLAPTSTSYGINLKWHTIGSQGYNINSNLNKFLTDLEKLKSLGMLQSVYHSIRLINAGTHYKLYCFFHLTKKYRKMTNEELNKIILK